jgi:hypothetical protein
MPFLPIFTLYPYSLLQNADMSKPREAVLTIVLKEYDLISEYYHKSIQERFKLFDWYIRIVPIPVTVLLAIITYLGKEESLSSFHHYFNILGYLFILLFLCGLSLYIVYIKQGNNTTKYFIAMSKLRNALREIHPFLEKSLVVDKLVDQKDNGKTNKREVFVTVKFWRGVLFIIFNSFTLAVGTYFILKHWFNPVVISEIIAISIFIACFVSHLIIYRSMSIPRSQFVIKVDE